MHRHINSLFRRGLLVLCLLLVFNTTYAQEVDNKIYIFGNVKFPGAYDYSKQMTVLHALSFAGSFGEWAKTKRIIIARDIGDGRLQYFKFNFKRVADGKPVKNFILYPGDTIIVS